MEVLRYTEDLAKGVTACYNRVAAGLHHCHPATTERIRTVLDPAMPAEGLCDHTAWVVRDGGDVVAIAQASTEQRSEDEGGPRGALRFFAYETGHRHAGQVLLEAVEAHLRERELREVIAFHQDHRWPCFHLEHSYLTDRLVHIEALLGRSGYRRCAGEVYLDWPDLQPPEPPPTSVRVRLETETLDSRAQRSNFVVRAMRGEELAGQCWCASCGVSAPGTEAEDWALTTWLAVEEAYRGQHLGSHLLARALGEMRARGFKHAVISTSWSNYRAQLFYSNFGYRTSDWTYAWCKGL